jgi:hypothetical protein
MLNDQYGFGLVSCLISIVFVLQSFHSSSSHCRLLQVRCYFSHHRRLSGCTTVSACWRLRLNSDVETELTAFMTGNVDRMRLARTRVRCRVLCYDFISSVNVNGLIRCFKSGLVITVVDSFEFPISLSCHLQLAGSCCMSALFLAMMKKARCNLQKWYSLTV